MNIVHTYLKKRGVIGPWKIHPVPDKKFNQIVVIPAYAEFRCLPRTLQSINENSYDILKNTLIVVVINNSTHANIKVKTNNELTIQKICDKKYKYRG